MAVDTSRGVEQYRTGLLAEEKYSRERQARLKERVYDTFNQLLGHRGRPGLGPGTRLLDLGAADGSFVAICRMRGLEARGLDIIDGVNFERDRFPFPDESFDVVTANSVIEHLYSPAMFLSEARRVLRPGGALILVCPNWRYSFRTYFDDPTHVHPYSETSIRRVLRNASLVDIYVVPWLVKKPAWLWDLPRAFLVARWLIPFRGDAPWWVPSALKGRSASLLGLALKPSEKAGQP